MITLEDISGPCKYAVYRDGCYIAAFKTSANRLTYLQDLLNSPFTNDGLKKEISDLLYKY